MYVLVHFRTHLCTGQLCSEGMHCKLMQVLPSGLAELMPHAQLLHLKSNVL